MKYSNDTMILLPESPLYELATYLNAASVLAMILGWKVSFRHLFLSQYLTGPDSLSTLSAYRPFEIFQALFSQSSQEVIH